MSGLLCRFVVMLLLCLVVSACVRVSVCMCVRVKNVRKSGQPSVKMYSRAYMCDKKTISGPGLETHDILSSKEHYNMYLGQILSPEMQSGQRGLLRTDCAYHCHCRKHEMLICGKTPLHKTHRKKKKKKVYRI